MPTPAPLVSAVIPTRHRPDLLLRALRSVFAQTHAPVEAVVVVDGPDPQTLRALAAVEDPRLRVVALEHNVGGGQARNVGVEHSRGEWVAFLDDDDEWLPAKVERQLAVAARSRWPSPVLASQVIARGPGGERVWPRRAPREGEDLSEYLLARRTLSFGEGLLQTSSLLARRQLLREAPFTPGLKRHQDWDWVLRVCRLPGVGVELLMEPLAVWYVEERRSTVSTGTNWQASLEWILASRPLVTPWAFAAFVLTHVGSSAAREGAWSAFLPLLGTALQHGRPRPLDLALYLSWWAVPQELRRRARELLRPPRG
jgi:hypothetical protein